jgi:hypothetical protein
MEVVVEVAARAEEARPAEALTAAEADPAFPEAQAVTVRAAGVEAAATARQAADIALHLMVPVDTVRILPA